MSIIFRGFLPLFLARFSLCSGGFFRRFYVDGGDKNAWNIKIKRVMENPQRVFISLLSFLFSNTSRHIPHILHFFPFRSSLQEARQVALTFFLLNRYVPSSGKYHVYSCGLTVFRSWFSVQVCTPCKCDVENSAVQAAGCNWALFLFRVNVTVTGRC